MKDRERIRQAETETEMNRQRTEEKGERVTEREIESIPVHETFAGPY